MILSDVSIKRPVFATIMNVVLIVFGLLAYLKLGIDQYPEVDFPVVSVRVLYPGADPKTIEEKVLDPLEKGLNGVQGLETLSGTAYPNLGVVTLQFKLERDGDKAAQDVRDKVSGLVSLLPEEAEAPVVAKFDIAGAPVLTMAVSSSTVPFAELSRLSKDVVKPALEQIQGVGNVELVGQREREIHVNVNRAALQSFGIGPTNVLQAIQAQNVDIPSGKIESRDSLTRVRTEGTLRSAEQISKVVVPLQSGQKIRVEDVATVLDTLADEDGFATFNGETAIVLPVYKQSGGNTVTTANMAYTRIEELKKTLPEGVNLQIVQDNSTYIKGSIDSVKFDLVLGAILAVVIVLFFLHDWRATIISACAIPTSVIATFAFVNYMGFTLNMMTTLALTLSIGILVDDAIVVIENIFSRLEKGDSPVEAARRGTSEIGLAAIAITLSIVAVFVPVAFMEGIVGRFFYQFGLTVAFSVMVSLFVAFTLTPMMSSRMLKPHSHDHKPAIFMPIERMLRAVENGYKSLLAQALRFRALTIMGGVGFLVLSIFLLKFVPVAFFPKEDRSMFTVIYELPEGSPLSMMKEKVREIDGLIRAYPGIKSSVMSIGANLEKKPNLARIDVNMVPKSERAFSQDEMVDRMRKDLITKVDVKGGEKLTVSEQSGGGGGQYTQPIQLQLRSADATALKAFADTMRDFMRDNVPGTVEVQTTEPPLVREYRVQLDPVRAADLGVSTAQVGSALRTLYEGEQAGEIEDKGLRYDVKVKVDDLDSRSKLDLTSVQIPNARGTAIALTSVASIVEQESLSKVERQSGQRQITVLANFKGADLNAAVTAIEKETRAKLPAGVSYSFEGQAKTMQESLTAMLSALVLAIVLVYMVLCAQFESYAIPFVIMMSVPLAFSGAFAGLLLTQKAMSIFAMIGLIMLMGLVTKNAILLIDFTLAKMKEGMAITDSLVEAGAARLRPIVMTTAAMIFGMLPIAIGHGEGGEARAPMAVCVIGGLISSTLLTLVVVPCIFSVVEGARARLGSISFGRRKAHAAAAASVGAELGTEG